jgi:uncharacterized membrane protein
MLLGTIHLKNSIILLDIYSIQGVILMKTNGSVKKLTSLKMTLVVVGLFSLLGLVIDSGDAYLERQYAQRAAEAAAQAGAKAMARGGDFILAAQARAARDGYAHDGSINRVLVNNPPGLGCSGKSNSHAGEKEFVQVVIHSDFHLYFAQIVGIREAHTCVEAVERATPPALSFLD